MTDETPETAAPTAADVLVRCLEAEGVQYIFGIPGEENLEVIEALKGSSIRFITTRHEQGAAFMADVYGRLTGRAGVCLATLGPGATNLITGVADANSDGAPLVAITGQVGTERMHLTSHQYLDLEGLFSPVTKRTKQVLRPDSIPEIVRICFKYAQDEKPGAAHIDLPCNIAAMPVPEGVGRTPLVPVPEKVEFPALADVQAARDIIDAAERTVVLVGHAAVRSHAARALTAFARALNIPVVNTMMAKGVIPDDDALCMGTVGIPQKDYQNVILDRADLVICVGYDLVEYAPGKWNKALSHGILHIDARPAHVNSYYQPQLQVVGDVSAALDWIAESGRRHADPEFALQVNRRRLAEFHSTDADGAWPMKPQRILSDVRRVMGRDDILVSDVGAHKMWIARHYGCYEPNTCIISNGFATMGIAVPGALAAKLANPDKRVLAVSGDGGFMMNCQEIETAVRCHIPFVTLIFTDASYGLIKWKQNDRYGTSSMVDFTNPDFVLFAQSMGAKGFRIEDPSQLVPTLEEAFASDVPCIIDCPVDYGQNTLLTEHLATLVHELEG